MDTSAIKFGTDGWRAIVAEDFTFDNVRACAQGVASYHLEQGLADQPVVVGYDTRFASEEFAAAVAEVLAGNGLPVALCSQAAPTPVVSWNIIQHRAAGGVMITASHNPALWNGVKYRTHYGGSASPELLQMVEDRVTRLRHPREVRRMPLAEAREKGLVREIDPADTYLEHLRRMVDLASLKDAGLSVVVDAMHGAGAGYLGSLLEGGRTRLTELRSERNPAFPGMHNPEPIARNLDLLSQTVVATGAHGGLALDGDADRLGVVDERGEYVSALHVYALLAYYLLEVRGQRGPIVKSVTVGSMPWRLGERYGVTVHETGVGFKHIAPLMVERDALLGGEESGGYAFRGHLPERDGILSGLLVLDLMARTGKRPSQLIEELHRIVGPHHYDRIDVPFDAARRAEVEARIAAAQPADVGGLPVTGRDALDGARFHLEGGAWALVRFSGTEPLLRLYAEAESPERVRSVLEATRALAGV